MISEVDDNMSGSIDFGEFLKVIETQKERAAQFDDESDLIDAYVACEEMPTNLDVYQQTCSSKLSNMTLA